MYFAMKDIGLDSRSAVRAIPAQGERWRALDALAQRMGAEGMHIDSRLYGQNLGLSLEAVPDFIRRYRLTYHLGGLPALTGDEEIRRLHGILDTALSHAAKNGFRDVSFHPPLMPPGMGPARGFFRERFEEALSAWLPRYRWEGVSLSLESRVHGSAFIFQGMSDYTDFILGMDGLKALVNIAHVCYDGYSENDLLAWIKPLPLSGFHISGADTALPMERGTHMPVGTGTVGLRRFLAPFMDRSDLFGALDIKAPFEDICFSAEMLRKYRAG